MNTNTIQKHFAKIGAHIVFEDMVPARQQWWASPAPIDYSLDVQSSQSGREQFVFSVSKAFSSDIDMQVLQSLPADRSLLTLVVNSEGRRERFLCGFDEREWFVAAVPGTASTVVDAKEALKPSAVIDAQVYHRLKAKDRNRRHNKAYIRQGEWFFVPVEDVDFAPFQILQNEPISRGRGSKPHIVKELVRSNGETVYVNWNSGEVLTVAQYNKRIKANPSKRIGWQVSRRNPEVYARGTVRHPDHKTVKLRGWHKVLMNTENQTSAMQNVAFLD